MTASTPPPDLALPAIDLDQPTAQQIHAALRAGILTLALPPGTRLSEAETGARFGASRTPVREAMTWLRDEGLIVTWPSRGNFVTRISEDVVRNAQFVREALETAALARICATGLDPEDDARMDAALGAQAAALAAGDTAAFHAADDAFHAALAGATGLSRVRTLVMREKTALDRLRALALGDPGHLRLLEDEHGRILNAIRKGRADRAQRVLGRHLTRVLDVLEDLKAAHGDYFE
ncbi:GntR family transcriptional regulator [Roseicyclus sp.]|uniref:GntR family transcriptional regulator n=1 Tax=Roseicyclus sp. TaxID=1914329 RepID=UPI003F9F1A08